MRDTRFQELAAQLAGYSTALRPGDRVLLELTDIPEEMGVALIREVRAAGALPFLRLNQTRLNREMLSGAVEEQYEAIARHRMAEMEDMDAYIEIRGGGNAFEFSSRSPGEHGHSHEGSESRGPKTHPPHALVRAALAVGRHGPAGGHEYGRV